MQIDNIQYLKAIFPAHPLQGGNTNTSGQGMGVSQVQGADAWHKADLTGQDIKLGIIGVGFYGYEAAVNSGDLPEPAASLCVDPIPNSNSKLREMVLSACSFPDSNAGRHGTAATEALMAVALRPRSTWLKYGMKPYLPAAVTWLIQQGVDIIKMSLGSNWHGPGHGTAFTGWSPFISVDRAIQRRIT